MMRVYLALGIVLLAAGAAQLGLRYDELPARMATHFNLGGQADGWSSKDTLFVVHLTVLAGVYATFGLLLLLSRRGGREYLNVPHRDLWLSPPHEAKARAMIERTMAWIGLATMLFLLTVFEFVFRANLRDPARLTGGFVWIVVAFVIVVTASALTLSLRFRRPPRRPSKLDALALVFAVALALASGSTLLSCAPRGPQPAARIGGEQTGIASYYGAQFAGRRTANGEIFDPRKLSAAHKTLPFDTVVLVTNLDNGRTLELRVNDRGPFIPGRIIDVSERAAEVLGFKTAGLARVRIEVVKTGGDR